MKLRTIEVCLRTWLRRMKSVYTWTLRTDAPPHGLEVDDNRRFCCPYEGYEPRDLYFSGAEFFQIRILFALGRFYLLEDLAGYAS